MHNKIFIIIILLCGIASASALDYVNRNLCNIKTTKYTVTITCTPRTDEFTVRKMVFTVDKDLSECKEVFSNEDNSYSTREFHNALNIFASYDEFGVRETIYYSKEDTKEACLFLYNEYKKAARRW